MKEYLIEIIVTVDDDEVETEVTRLQKEIRIRRAIESLDPAIGIFEVNRFEVA